MWFIIVFRIFWLLEVLYVIVFSFCNIVVVSFCRSGVFLVIKILRFFRGLGMLFIFLLLLIWVVVWMVFFMCLLGVIMFWDGWLVCFEDLIFIFEYEIFFWGIDFVVVGLCLMFFIVVLWVIFMVLVWDDDFCVSGIFEL